MTFKSASGYALIELVVFIIVVGLAMVGIIAPLTTILVQTPISVQQVITNELARARMEMIIGQHIAYGYSGVTDKCQAGSPPAICTLPAALSGYTVSSTNSLITINGTANYKSYVVTASTTNGNVQTVLEMAFGSD